MESFRYGHVPRDCCSVQIALFTDVSNAAQIKSRIVRASQLEGPEGEAERDAVNFAFIDAGLICSVMHLQTAVYQAILAHVQGSLRTKSVHSEILWALNPTNNISEAIRRFGVGDTTRSLLVVRIGSGEAKDVERLMSTVVSGTLTPLASLSSVTDWASVEKYYKLNGDAAKDAAQRREIVTSTVATKSVMG